MLIQGDNLEAIKALPLYANQVKCIYIEKVICGRVMRALRCSKRLRWPNDAVAPA